MSVTKRDLTPAGAGQQDHRVQFAPLPQPRWRRNLFYGYVVAVLAFLVWRCTVVNWNSWIGPVLVVADVLGAVTFVALLWQVRSPTIPVHRPVDLSRYVVDCLIPTHTEAVEIIEPTVIGAIRIRGVRRVVVLSNTFRQDVRDMALRNGAEYHARDALEFGKAGNLNAGLAHTDAEFVVTLDADHIPCPNLLERTLGHFDDPRIALVQTPQSFYNLESFAFRRTRRGLWSESLLFYRHVQPSKNHWNASFYVGTSAVLRRSALDSIDGFATGTVTEDIHTALRLHAAGWHTVFVPEPVAFGLEAGSLREFHSQRRRWAAGSFQLLLRHPDSPLRRRGLSMIQRLHYGHATATHFMGPMRIVQMLTPVLAVLLLASPVVISYWGFAMVFLAYTLATWSMMMLYIGSSYHPIHSEAYSIAMAPSQIAALASLFRVERRFKAANKQARPGERTWVKAVLSAMAILCLATVGVGIWRTATGGPSGLVISGTVWAGIHAVWIGSMLTYLFRYERLPARPYESMTAMERYRWVMEQGVAQIEAARQRVVTVDPAARQRSVAVEVAG